MLRSCYTTLIRPYSDSNDTVRIRWFFVDDGKPLPFPTVFGSRNWLRDKTREYPLGEVKGADRDWADGSKPPWFDPAAPCDCWKDPVRAVEGAKISDPQCQVPLWCSMEDEALIGIAIQSEGTYHQNPFLPLGIDIQSEGTLERNPFLPLGIDVQSEGTYSGS